MKSNRQKPSCNPTYSKQIYVRQCWLNRVLQILPTLPFNPSHLRMLGQVETQIKKTTVACLITQNVFCPGIGLEATNPNQHIIKKNLKVFHVLKGSRMMIVSWTDLGAARWPRLKQMERNLFANSYRGWRFFPIRYQLYQFLLPFFPFVPSQLLKTLKKPYFIDIICCGPPKPFNWLTRKKRGPYTCPGMCSRRWELAISSYLASEIWLGMAVAQSVCLEHLILWNDLQVVSFCFCFWAKGLSISQYLLILWSFPVGILGSQVCALDGLRTRAKHVIDGSMET